MKEAFAAHNSVLEEQARANALMQKFMPIMKSLLLQRMVSKQPLKVMRPLAYTTEALPGEEEENDGFYSIQKSEQKLPEFQSVRRVIYPGTELTFQYLEKGLNQLWFKTGTGEDVGFYLEEQNGLLTQTDIFETVSKILESEEEK
jgi:hypothetical protein